jgi:membrane-bound metal-dependent hydrolase YbcI (DUF457 family)
MDNLTHTLIGIGLARAGISQRLGRGTTMVLAVTSNLPDLDVVCLAGGPLGFLWRRTVTHSLVGAVVLGLAASFVFRRLYPNLSWISVGGLTAIGIAGHIFADLWNSYGVVLFWPFSWRRVDLDWVFIIDLVVWAILGTSFVSGRLAHQYQAWIWRVGLGLLALYIGTCAFASLESYKLLLQQKQRDHVQSGGSFLYPEPFGISRFRGVTRASDYYVMYQIWPFQKRVELLERLEVKEQTAVVEATIHTEAGRRLDWFFSTPIWRTSSDGEGAVVYGLGFRTRILPSRTPFIFHVTADGKVSRAAAERARAVAD